MEEENIVLPTCEVDLVVYQTMLRDQLKFNQLALGLIAEHRPQHQLNYDFDFEPDDS